MKTEFQKCMDGEIFDGKDKELAEMTLKTKRLLVKLNSTDYADTKQKEAILREMFGHLGENVHVDIDFRCEYGKNIFVGNKVIINMNCTFVDNNRIEIGNNVLIASNVQIYTATHSTNGKSLSGNQAHEQRARLKIKRAISRPRVAPILSLFKLQIIQQQQQQSQLQQSQQQQYQLLLLQLLLQQQRYQ